MKILIHDEHPDALEFLLEVIVKRGYEAGIAKDNAEIFDMLTEQRYDIVLTNSEYRRPDQNQHLKSSSVFIISITDRQKRNEQMDSGVDMYLHRPFEASKLWQIITPNVNHH